MSERTDQNEAPNVYSWSAKFFEHLKTILDRYFKMFPQHEGLETFMSDEGQMYDESGSPTEQYLDWIRQFNEFCKENPIEDSLEDLNQNQLEVMKGAREFLLRQKELRESYRASSDKDKWLESVLDSPEKRNAFDQLVNKSILEGINEVNKVKSKK